MNLKIDLPQHSKKFRFFKNLPTISILLEIQTVLKLKIYAELNYNQLFKLKVEIFVKLNHLRTKYNNFNNSVQVIETSKQQY